MKNSYQIFGSKSSLDLDVCFFVDNLFSIDENHKKTIVCIKESDIKTSKKINANLAILDKGVVVSCFKGVEDELNNALYTTYNLHNQKFENNIKRLVTRDLNARIERCARSLVSYFTRTPLRSEAKMSLKGNLINKINFLEKISLKKIDDFGKNGTKIEVYKAIAFQLGITLALYDDIELYTKESIVKKFPKMKSYLLREEATSVILEEYIKQFVCKTKKNI